MDYHWDAEGYSKASSQQQKWARELITGLGLKGDEHLLDIGCGDGKVTVELAGLLPRGFVTGIDVSSEMIDFAREAFPPETCPNLDWQVMDAATLTFEGGFDLVFSNATLHWIVDQRPVLAGIVRALEPGGRLAVSMGGRGNAGEVVEVFGSLIAADEWSACFDELANPYGFYGPEEYRGWLEEAGLVPVRVELVPKDMTQPGRDGLAAWVRTTWLPFTMRVPEDRREEFIYEIVDTYLEAHPLDTDGLAHVGMVRLEVEALKPR